MVFNVSNFVKLKHEAVGTDIQWPYALFVYRKELDVIAGF